MARRTLPVALLCSGALWAGVAGCTSTPTPDGASRALAEGLSRLDVATVPFQGTTGGAVNEQLTTSATGMKGIKPAVTVEGTKIDGEDNTRATANLRVAWTVAPGQVWTDTTTAPFRLVEGKWQVEWGPAILAHDLKEGERLVLRRTAAPRADIVSGDGTLLVTARRVAHVGIDRTRVDPAQAGASAAELARVVDVDPAEFRKRVEAAGPKAFVPAITLRFEDYQAKQNAIDAITGGYAVGDRQPLAPARTFARPVLGTVAAATAENIKAGGGAIAEGDWVGQIGLQKRFDERLRGRAGQRVEIVGAAGAPPRVQWQEEPATGEKLTVTLSADVQNRAEAALADLTTPGALVVIRPSDGAVLAAAVGPPTVAESIAVAGKYPPGSTFKVVTALALLRAGVEPSTPVECPETLTVDGYRFKNYDDYPAVHRGTITFRTAIAQSCNTALVGMADKVTQQDLADAAAALGLAWEGDMGVPTAAGGVGLDTNKVGHAASMIGQGTVEASPLGMATVAASVAAGRTVTPVLTDATKLQPPSPRRPLTPAEAAALQELMRAVVTEGSASFLNRWPDAGAKTGTAEYGTENPPRTHAWMIYQRGDLAVAVLVTDGASGARVAGPILTKFLAAG